MKIRTSDKALERFLERVSSNNMFMASTLALYCSSNGMSEVELCEQLGCTEDNLARLALCRRPQQDTDAFKREIEKIACYSSISPTSLLRLLREVTALESLRSISTNADSTGGFLAAARDRDDSDMEQEPEK